MRKLFFLFCLLQSLITFAQNPTDVEHNFGPFPGFNSKVDCAIVQTDGKILVGGNFTSYRGVVQNHLIRLNTDGSKDNSFDIGTGFEAYSIYSLALQPDGKILVGGDFSSYQRVYQNYLIRLNPDGSKDNSFKTEFPNINSLNRVQNITLQSDGKILMSTYNVRDSIRYGLIRLNSDGKIDNSFDMGIRFNDEIRSIALQSDGKIIIGGSFTTYQGATQTYLIRLNPDGTKDSSFNIGSGFPFYSVVESITIQTNGKILVAGNFNKFNGISQNRLIRLNSDGSKDTSFKIEMGFDYNIHSIALQKNEKIIVGGTFNSYNGIKQKN